MFHVVRDTVQGCTLRSHFYLGALMADCENKLSEEVGFGLMEHCYSEFTYLASFFLPFIMLKINMEIKLRLFGSNDENK
jgi:hypothetical protein